MKNLFEYRKKYSLPEITRILGDAISKTSKGIEVLIIDRKIHIKSKKNPDLNVEVFFDTNGTHGDYSIVDLRVINTNSQVSSNHLRILFTNRKYGYREDLRGGHFWATDNEFYAYVPDFNLVVSEIGDYLKFLGIS